MSTNEQLLQQIDDLVATKTFNLYALDSIKIIKDNFADTLAELNSANKKLELRKEENQKLMTDLVEKEAKISRLSKTIEEMRSTAEKGQEAIYNAEKHKAVAEAWQGAMAMVFKPNAVRETVQRQVSVPVTGHSGGNGCSPTAGWVAQNTDHETTTREDA